MELPEEVRSVMEQAHELRSALDPRDIPDAQFLMSKATRKQMHDALIPERLPNSPPWPPLDSLFGIPVQEDNTLPDGVVRLVAENGFDRAIRRARERGITVNATRMVVRDLMSPPPVPTLRALLRHWWNQVRHG